MLQEVALFLTAAVLFVPLFKRLRLGAVLGYLAAGLVIGPSGLGLARDVDKILHFSEFGVVLLLFLIGLELQPSRLWRLRRSVFGLGGAQVVATGLLLALPAWAYGLPPTTAIVLGFVLASSSTALVLQLLAERNELNTRHGRAAFSVLLFQDLSVIPLLAAIPLLAPGSAQGGSWLAVGKALIAVAAVVGLSRTLLRPLLRRLAATGLPEIFTAAALLLVIAVSLAMQAVGLSMALGAFLAGMMLSNSEYRHQLQADLEAFKGLLLGLFFIAVGMGADLSLAAKNPVTVICVCLSLMAGKAAVLYALGRAFGEDPGDARRFAVVLAQGGEFAFVLFAVVANAQLLDASQIALLTVAVTLSMMLTPLFYHWAAHGVAAPQAAFDEINTAETPVVIAGFGPFGQIVGRILRLKKVPYTVLDKNAQHVDFVRSFGNPVFYSDAARHEVLRAAHVDKAQLVVVAIADPVESLRVVEAVRSFAPTVRVMAGARTRQHAIALMDLGLTHKDVIRRSFYSSLEMTRRVLLAIGINPDAADRAIQLFAEKDEETLKQQEAGPHDEDSLRQTAQQFAAELEQLFDADEAMEKKL